ncbi:MAG TPA: hypothetical protein VLV89_03960 [Candidatus Acidoferrum sp.]|nr:hypothetical protein [Candidatus Acidoferrum sp.]
MNYFTVYQIAPKGISGFALASLLLMLLVCCVIYLSSYLNGKKLIRGVVFGSGKKAIRIWAMAFAGLATIIFSLIVWSELSASSSCYAAFKSGHYSVVEGKVEDFQPMPYSGHAYEQFRVGNVRFAYTEFSDGPGFNHTSSHGGPITAGMNVRISYSEECNGTVNTILKLEVVPPGWESPKAPPTSVH